jgi:hypothetical protein
VVEHGSAASPLGIVNHVVCCRLLPGILHCREIDLGHPGRRELSGPRLNMSSASATPSEQKLRQHTKRIGNQPIQLKH